MSRSSQEDHLPSGRLIADAKEIARNVRNGDRTREELEKCFCIRCQYALGMLDKGAV